MSWVQTASGKKFDFKNITLDSIDINDIAHALSLSCRFGGHCQRFYSVAEHSVRTSYVAKDMKWALMHDAAEAYIGDMATPLKSIIPAFRDMEEKVLSKIAEKFGLTMPIPDEVKIADAVLLATEKEYLMVKEPESWNLSALPLNERIVPWSPEFARKRFLQRFGELFGFNVQ